MLIALRWLESSKSPFKISESQLEVTIAFRLLGRVEPAARRVVAECRRRKSQSPFGFWGEWNNSYSGGRTGKHFRGHNRLLAFWGSGTSNDIQEFQVIQRSQSPFGFWGEWNSMPISIRRGRSWSHNRLSAFGASGTHALVHFIEQAEKVTIAFRLLGGGNSLAVAYMR